MEEKVTVCMISGGLDSLIALKALYEQGYEIHGVFLNLGQENVERALISARKMNDKYCSGELEILTLTSNKREQFDTERYLPEESATKIRVPFVGTVATILTAVVAVCDGILCLASGKRITPRPEGDGAHKLNLKRVLSGGFNGEEVVQLQPLEDVPNVADAVQIGLNLGMTLEEMGETVSCNRTTPCGICRKCQARKELGIMLN